VLGTVEQCGALEDGLGLDALGLRVGGLLPGPQVRGGPGQRLLQLVGLGAGVGQHAGQLVAQLALLGLQSGQGRLPLLRHLGTDLVGLRLGLVAQGGHLVRDPVAELGDLGPHLGAQRVRLLLRRRPHRGALGLGLGAEAVEFVDRAGAQRLEFGVALVALGGHLRGRRVAKLVGVRLGGRALLGDEGGGVGPQGAGFAGGPVGELGGAVLGGLDDVGGLRAGGLQHPGRLLRGVGQDHGPVLVGSVPQALRLEARGFELGGGLPLQVGAEGLQLLDPDRAVVVRLPLHLQAHPLGVLARLGQQPVGLDLGLGHEVLRLALGHLQQGRRVCAELAEVGVVLAEVGGRQFALQLAVTLLRRGQLLLHVPDVVVHGPLVVAAHDGRETTHGGRRLIEQIQPALGVVLGHRSLSSHRRGSPLMLVAAPTRARTARRGGPPGGRRGIRTGGAEAQWAAAGLGSTSSSRMPPVSFGWQKLIRESLVPRRASG